MAGRTPWATPFARWGVHRAWWDAYGESAHEQTLEVIDPSAPGDGPVAFVPLMHRHETEPGDDAARTELRHVAGLPLAPVEPTAMAVFFGATYHADYATILADPARLPDVADAVVDYLAAGDGTPDGAAWDAVDLRRLRCGDPAADALVEAFRARSARQRWTVTMEREDVCPVVTLPEGLDFDGFLGTLGKTERHEIRRKVRRAENAGDVRLEVAADPLAELDGFIELHQKRWGERGLFPPTAGGDASRVFFRRLLEHLGPDGPFKLARLTVGGRTIAAGAHFDDGETLYYYNAGVDPDARELSPGVVLAARYVQTAIELGRRRVDFLRGNESYKYEWGAIDEPIQRILVTREA
jgi:CelD/BcsL family acetyltransferase involved in cellulose biosynthesis